MPTRSAAQLELLRTHGFVLTLASSILFLYTFVLGYLLLCVPQGVPYQSGIYFGGLAVSWLVTVVCFWVAHRRIFPGPNRERLQRIAMMLLVPTGAMRAPATLSRNLLANFHPLAVAASVLCSADTFRTLAQRSLLSVNQLAHAPASTGGDSQGRNRRLVLLPISAPPGRRRFPTELGTQWCCKLRTPDPDDGSPIIRVAMHEFVVLSGVCRECGNATLLLPFSKANATVGIES